MIDKIRTFTYLLLACDRDQKNHAELRASWDGHGCSDILELFLEGEEQVAETDDIGDGELEYWTDRVAPVQMALGWDVRAYLVAVLKQAGFEPTSEIGRPEESAILYYEHVPTTEAYNIATASTPVGYIENAQDKERFDEVLRVTLELVRKQQRGLIFAWAWGFDYEIDGQHLNHPEIRAGLEKHGLKFFTRHG